MYVNHKWNFKFEKRKGKKKEKKTYSYVKKYIQNEKYINFLVLKYYLALT